MKCRHCGASLELTFIDLGTAPPSNAYLSAADLDRPEQYLPLRVKVCTSCWLVQTEDYTCPEHVFRDDYAYFSSTSSTWAEHAAQYAATIISRLGLSQNSYAVEVACNDGYLLRHFVARGIPCLGIEPTASTAQAAEQLGIPVRREFFGETLSRELAKECPADLIIGNNVYAHVPDINDFTRGLATALAPSGTITLEFPHLLQLIENNQFDTIYHEHFSYLSLGVVDRVFRTHGLRVWDVEPLPTHGGSLRVFGCHATDPRGTAPAVPQMLEREAASGLFSTVAYELFQARAERIKNDLMHFLIAEKRQGRSVAAYGAAAKGNTLLNFAGVRRDLIAYVCDAAPSKQGRWMPGSRIPILPPSALLNRRPDTLVILPWNIAGEIIRQNATLAERGTRFVTAVPTLRWLS
jgi:SAM-dependent methyltransferase